MTAAPSAFDAGQRALLEKIAHGAPLQELLTDLVLLVEQQAEDMACSVLLVDAARGTVHPIAAPTLPLGYTRSLEGLAIGPEAGSCGTAAYRRERVIVEDIASHPYWREYKALALPHGLRACWSSPILSAEREILGTFAMYYREPRGPLPHEIAWVDAATHIATIAIMRDRFERALHASVDLSAYKRVQEEARAGERVRSLIYDQVTDVIFYLSVEQDGRFYFRSVNRAFVSATGLRESEVVGRAIDQVIPEPSRSVVLARYAEAIARRAPVSWEQTTRFPSGVRTGEVSVAPIFDAAGRCTHLVGTVHDLTARKLAEDERRSLELRLREAQRLQELGALAGGIAHDFNNILSAVGGHAELALLSAQDGAKQREHLDEVRKACQRANRLVRQFLAFGRRDALQREPVGLRAIVEEALGLLRGSLPRELRVELLAGPSAYRVLADATQAHQVIMNVVTNAVQAMSGRAGTIQVALDWIDSAADAPHSDLAPGRYARLRVCDQGCGMSAETLARAFDPFFTTKPQATGTGLGLSVVHGIMKSHEGAVTVDSVEGQGTTFDLFFPAVHQASDAPRTPLPPSMPLGRVLYVDDDDALVYLGVRLLRRLGYRATGASDSIEALALFRADPGAFDLVVSDVGMPKLSGPDLVRELKRLQPDVRTLLVSGYAADVRGSRGSDEVALKPQTPEELRELLRRVLEPARSSA